MVALIPAVAQEPHVGTSTQGSFEGEAFTLANFIVDFLEHQPTGP